MACRIDGESEGVPANYRDEDNPSTDDLLYISGEMIGFSLSVIGACLVLPPADIEDTKSRDFKSDRDKIHRLLVKWKEANRGKCSWTDLTKCLQGLNNTTLMDSLNSYLKNKQGSRTTSGAVVTLTPHETESLINVQDQYSSLESGHREESTSLFQQYSSERESLPGSVSQALVTGKSMQPADYRSRSVNRETMVEVEKMEEKFAYLVSEVQCRFESSGISIDRVRVYLTQLSGSIREDIPLPVFNEHVHKIVTHSTPAEVFQILSISGLWSFLNYYLLKRLVDRFGDGPLKKEVTAYKEEMEVFKQKMKLSDFLSVWSGRSTPHSALYDLKPVIMKVNRDWPSCTLADIADIENFLESRFLIRRFFLNFANAHSGCVTVMWLVPAHVIHFLKRVVSECGLQPLSKENVIELSLGTQFVVNVSFKTVPSPYETNLLVESLQTTTLLESLNFDDLYQMSIHDSESFWGTLAKQFIQWEEQFQKVCDCDMKEGIIRWFTKGKLNVSVNCVDRHAQEYPDRIALIWEKDKPGQEEKITYKQLLDMVCQIGNVLRMDKGVKKGDLVIIYMPVCPLAVASMLACARIGAVHSVLFSRLALVKPEGKRNQILEERIARAKVVITANAAHHGDLHLPLKDSLAEVLPKTSVEHVLVYKRTHMDVHMESGRDQWLHEAMDQHSTDCKPEWMDSEDDLFIMYTSGASGTSKGIVHSQAGYLLYVAVTHKITDKRIGSQRVKYIQGISGCMGGGGTELKEEQNSYKTWLSTMKYYFDYQPGEIYACVADIGWITGHSYVVYGPLCNGATTVLFDSVATYPNPGHYWEMINRIGVNHFYTIPSVIRELMVNSDEGFYPNSFDLSSLRIIGSVGECITTDAWTWYFDKVGKGKCHLVDTWWQTELGGIAMSPPPGIKSLKPGKAMKPSFGVVPLIVDVKDGKVTECKDQLGKLYLKAPLPGMGRRLTGENGHSKFKEEYFNNAGMKGLYFTSDIAHQDQDGDYQIIGRSDDVIRYKGALLNIPYIENMASASHKSIVETTLVPCDEDQLANGEPKILACVSVKDQLSTNEMEEVKARVKQSIVEETGISNPKLEICHHQKIRKTYSGKIMRHLLREIDCEFDQELGTSPPEADDYIQELSEVATGVYNKEYVQ